MTIAGKVIDVFDDVSGEILRDLAVGDIPEMAKTASVSPDVVDGLPDENFAVVMFTKEAQKIRKYPLHDPGNAWLSSQFFDRTHGSIPKHAAVVAAKNIKHACDAYDIKCSSTISKLASIADCEGNAVDLSFELDEREIDHKIQNYHMQKVASLSGRAREIFDQKIADIQEAYKPVTRYGLSKTAEQSYPLRNRREVKVASEYFVENLERFGPLQRVEFAKNMIKAAIDMGISDMPYDVKLYGSERYNPWMHGELIKRAEYLDDNSAELLSQLEERSSELKPDEFAAAVYELEKEAGVDQFYDDTIADPFSVIKMAEELTDDKRGVDITHEGETFNTMDLSAPDVQKKLSKYFRSKMTKALVDHPVETFEGLAPQLKGVVVGIVKGRM